MSAHELTLTSFAQPVWSVPHGRVVGWEALLRVQDGARVLVQRVHGFGARILVMHRFGAMVHRNKSGALHLRARCGEIR